MNQVFIIFGTLLVSVCMGVSASAQAKTIRNEKCEDVEQVKIFQVIATPEEAVSACIETLRDEAPDADDTESVLLCEAIYSNEPSEGIKDIEALRYGIGSLANVCEGSSDKLCLGLTIFIPYTVGGQHYDEKIIKAPKDKCISYESVYRYETKGGQNKTVPIVRIVDAYVPSSVRQD